MRSCGTGSAASPSSSIPANSNSAWKISRRRLARPAPPARRWSRRPAVSGPARLTAGQVRGSLAALPPSPDLRAARHPARQVYTGGLGWPGSLVPAPLARSHPRAIATIRAPVRRRDHCAGARSRARANEDGPALGLCPRRSTMGRQRSADGGLCLCRRSQGRTGRGSSW